MDLEYDMAIMALEAKAISIRHTKGDKQIAAEVRAWQAACQADVDALRRRHAMERASRKRGDRVPNLQADPEAYVLWLQRQRALPYVQLARALDAWSRLSR